MTDDATMSRPAGGAPAWVTSGATYQFRAGAAGVVRRVLVTLNAATDVTAGSRFEAVTSEAIASRVNGLSPEGEVLQVLSDLPITRVHAAQAGAAGYLAAPGLDVADNQLALWEFPAGDDVRQVSLTIGPSPDGGLTQPVTCIAVPAQATRRRP